MRKFFTMLTLVGSLFMVAGCGEKTTEEKATEAAESAQKDAAAAAADAEEAAGKALEGLKK